MPIRIGPKKMCEPQFCKRCLYSSSHPFGLTFNSQGVCSGCQIHDEKYTINWSDSLDYLHSLLTKRSKVKSKKSPYDCIVPVIGDTNSFYILDFVVNRLGLNPLAVVYNKYWNTEVGIKNLALMKTVFNCDFYQRNVDPNLVRKLTQYSLSKFRSAYWHIHAGHYLLPVQAAVEFGVEFVIWGGHEGVEQVGMFSHKDRVEMSYRHWLDHHLGGVRPKDFYGVFDSFRSEDLKIYEYPSPEEINSCGVRGIYLSNYSFWDPAEQNFAMQKKYNTYTHKHARTFDIYEHVECFNYMDIHDFLKLVKLGYSRVTDHLTREIRHKRISRDAAIELLKEKEIEPLKYLSLYENWLGIMPSAWSFLFSEFSNESFVKADYDMKLTFNPLSEKLRSGNNSWISKRFNEIFQNTNERTLEFGENYITIGKGI